jgi:acetylornithine deacetylase
VTRSDITPWCERYNTGEEMMIDNESIIHYINKNKDEYLTLLKDLVVISDKSESKIQNIISDKFKELNCEVNTIIKNPISLNLEKEFASESNIQMTERISVVGKNSGTGGGKSILFFAHPDNEPVRNVEEWVHDPFSGEVENGKMYGWGIADDLVGVAIMTGALETVTKMGTELKGDVYLCSTASKKNARGIIAVLDSGYHADAAIYLHPAESGMGLEEIKAFASGMIKFKITVKGKIPETTEPGHTSFAHLGINPIYKSMLIIDSLIELDKKRGESVKHDLLDKIVGRSTNLIISSIICGNPDHPTRMAENCWMVGSMTFPPSELLEEVKMEILNVIDKVVESDEWLKENPVQIEWLFGSQAVEVSSETPLYQHVSDSIKYVTKKEPVVNPLHSASDIRNPILYRDIPTLGFGPLAGDLSQNGNHDEWVSIEDYINSIKICSILINNWCA